MRLAHRSGCWRSLLALPAQAQNPPGASVELEWEQQVGGRLRLLTNVTFLDEERTATWPTPRSPPPWRPGSWPTPPSFSGPRAACTARLNHVGTRNDDEETDGWSLLDLSLAPQDVGTRGLSLRGGVKNTFDDEVRYVVALPNGVQRNLFPGRTAWIQLAWDRP